MSRSIHQTRRDEEWERRRCERDREAPLMKLERIRERLEAKRDVKRRARQERSGVSHSPFPPVDPELIPIEVDSEEPYVHFPASPDDIRDVLRRLAPDALNGIRAIRLTLGSKLQREWIHSNERGWTDPGSTPVDPDPLSGRPGDECLPGVYSAPVLGVYHRTGTISLFAYVYAPDRENRRLIETILRNQMLSTLVHEVGHHEDNAFRSVEGRWRMADREKAEQYAETRQYRWLRDAVLPSVEERHPDDLRHLLDWVEEHGGVRMNLSDLTGDPRSSIRKGFVNIASIFPIESALFTLLEEVEKGEDPIATRIRFANEVHYSEDYETALAIVDGVLEEQPDEVEAMVVRGDLLWHLDRDAEARAALQRALELAPGHLRALEELLNVHYWAHSWPDVIVVAEEYLSRQTETGYEVVWVRARYARGLIEVGRFDEAEAAAADPGKSSSHANRFAGLRALSALRRGDAERALALADAGLADAESDLGNTLLRGVRRAALLGLDRGEEAEPLSERDRERLARQGLDDLVARPSLDAPPPRGGRSSS